MSESTNRQLEVGLGYLLAEQRRGRLHVRRRLHFDGSLVYGDLGQRLDPFRRGRARRAVRAEGARGRAQAGDARGRGAADGADRAGARVRRAQGGLRPLRGGLQRVRQDILPG